MNADRFRTLYEDVIASLWFIPVLCAGGAVLLSFIVPEIDRRIEQDLAPYRTWIFFGSADAARTMLSVIAGSLITVISLLFSITIVTLHQAAAQYTPRIIRTFMNDRTNQAVLGIYIATFLYSVLVMRRIRGEDAPGSESIPMLSVTFSILLAVVCLMLLVYFIHHIASEFQPATTIKRVHDEMLREIDTLYPERVGAPSPDADQDLDAFRESRSGSTSQIVAADSFGFLRMLDGDALPEALHDGEWAIVLPRVGSYVIEGQPLLEIGCDGPLEERAGGLRRAFLLDTERTMSQDAMFGVRQLSDIALKALSPSIHDPTTAEQVISVLGNGLARLSQRSFPARVRLVEEEPDDSASAKRVELWTNRPSWEDYVDEAFSQIRRIAQGNVHVTLYLLDTLREVAAIAPSEKCAALREQVHEILWLLDESNLSPRDRELIRVRAELTMDAARKPVSPVFEDHS